MAISNSLHFLPPDPFSVILSFLEPKDLARAERVCKTWKQFIDQTDRWKVQCQNLLDLPPEIDPKDYLPKGSSYKRSLQQVFANILDERVYERYVGEIGVVPRIPKGISLKKWNEPDPCDPTKKIGTEYVWMYVPTHIAIRRTGYSLSGLDDPMNPEVPHLIKGEKSEQNTVLKVPVTIHNLKMLFEHPRVGNPSTYRSTRSSLDRFLDKHRNKRISPGWVCMRKGTIGRYLSLLETQTFITSRGVVLSALGPRILFNFLERSRSGMAYSYPDGMNPMVEALTSTLISIENPGLGYFVCGLGGPRGLGLYFYNDIGCTGAVVELPEEVQAIDS